MGSSILQEKLGQEANNANLYFCRVERKVSREEEFAHLQKENGSLDVDIPQFIKNSFLRMEYATYGRICRGVGDKNVDVPEALQQYNRLINYYYENLDNDT
jgi:hypothetical protein